MIDQVTDRAERRVPPHPRGVVELLRQAGHSVVVREKARNTGFAYRLDGECERNALQLTNRTRKLGILCGGRPCA